MASEPCTPRTRTSRSRRRAAPLRWLEAWWAGPPSSAMGAVYKRWMWLFCRRTRAMLGSFLQRSLGPRKPPAHRQPQKLRMLLVATLLKLRPTHLPPLQPPPLPLQLPGRVLMRLLQWLMTVRHRHRRRRRRHRHRPPPPTLGPGRRHSLLGHRLRPPRRVCSCTPIHRFLRQLLRFWGMGQKSGSLSRRQKSSATPIASVRSRASTLSRKEPPTTNASRPGNTERNLRRG